MRLLLVLFICLLSSQAFAQEDALYLASTDKIFSKDRGGSFTLFVSEDGMLYHKISAEVSALDEHDKFKVLGKGGKEIGSGACYYDDFYLVDDGYLSDMWVCDMSFVDNHNRKVYLSKYLDAYGMILLITDGKIISSNGEELANWYIYTDDIDGYLKECIDDDGARDWCDPDYRDGSLGRNPPWPHP